MKKFALSLIFLLFLAEFYSQKLTIGPEIGINVIPIENTEIGFNHQLGYHAGGHLKYHFSEKFKLSSGLFLSQKKKGYSSSTTRSVSTLLDAFSDLGGGFINLPDTSGLDSLLNISGLNTDITESTKGVTSELFIEIPVLVNYKLKNVNFYAGPYVGILISASKKEEIITDIPLLDAIDFESLGIDGFTSLFLPSSGTTTENISGTDGLRQLDLGFNVGLGYEMNNLHFNFMYSQGLVDYRSDQTGSTKESLKLYRFSIAYLFNFKKTNSSNAKFN